MTGHHNHHACITSAISTADTLCAQRGLRLTQTRRRVLEIIWQSHKALSVPQIMHLLGNSQPPTTYRALEFLLASGLIHHITSLNAYIGCPHAGTEHTGQFLICSTCRDVTEIKAALPQLTDTAARNNFHVTNMHIEVLGLCTKCQGAASL